MLLLVWLSLAVALTATIAGSVYAVRRARELLGALRAGRTELAWASAGLEAETERLRTWRLDTTALERSLERLAVSRARLAVPLAALTDVRGPFGRLTGVVPRK